MQKITGRIVKYARRIDIVTCLANFSMCPSRARLHPKKWNCLLDSECHIVLLRTCNTSVLPELLRDVPVQPTRRDFLKITTAGGVAAAVFGFDLQPAYAELRELKIARASETRSTCPYCAVGCGTIIYTIGDRAKNVTAQVVHVEGDPDHPTNRGTLCPKGSSLQQEIMNDRRLLKPQVRRPGATDWQDISWDDAINEIAVRVKKTRDDTFIEKDAAGHTVNRLESVAWIGGCTDTNEFNYLAVKAMHALGVVHLENQARV